MTAPEFPAELIEKTTKALLVQWMTEAEAGTEDSPRGHCERLAHAVLAAVHDDIVQAAKAEALREAASAWISPGGVPALDPTVGFLLHRANDIARGTEAGR